MKRVFLLLSIIVLLLTKEVYSIYSFEIKSNNLTSQSHLLQTPENNMQLTVFFGNFFHNLSFDESESILDGFIAVEDGKV